MSAAHSNFKKKKIRSPTKENIDGIEPNLHDFEGAENSAV